MRRPTVATVVAIAICVALLLCLVPWIGLGLLVYLTFLSLLAWSAVRYRHTGWFAGLVFVFLSVSIPVWVGAGYWLYCWVVGVQAFGPGAGQPR